MPSIFLSHSTIDKTFTRWLAHRLDRAGAKVWIDEAEIKVGESLVQKLGSAITSSEYVAAVISKSSVTSSWVQHELQVAMTREIQGKKSIVLPLLIDDVEMPAYLIDKKYADFRRADNFEVAFAELLFALGLVGPPKLRELGTRIGLSMTTRSEAKPFGLSIPRFAIRHYQREKRPGEVIRGDEASEGLQDLSAGWRRIPKDLFTALKMQPWGESGIVFAQRNRVMIFWHERGFTQKDAVDLVVSLSSDGVLANTLKHQDPAPPDAIFISRDCHPWLVRRVLYSLPYHPKFIFPFSYPSLECGGPSDYALSVGLRAALHEGAEDERFKARPLSESVLATLSSPGSTDEDIAEQLKLVSS